MSGKKTAIHNIGTKHARTHMEKGKILRGVIRVEKVLSKGHTAHIVFKYNRQGKGIPDLIGIKGLPDIAAVDHKGALFGYMAGNPDPDSAKRIKGNAAVL